MKTEYNFYSLVLMIIAISFWGWCFENIWLAFTKGFVDNRCMALPFLLGYGLFIVILYMCLGTPQTFFAIGGHYYLSYGKMLYAIDESACANSSTYSKNTCQHWYYSAGKCFYNQL